MNREKHTKSRRILLKKEPEKRLLLNFKERAGRATSGRLTVRHKGGGVKKMYRIIDFGQQKMDMSGKVLGLEYDPNRTAWLALVEYTDGEKRYLIASSGMKEGSEIVTSKTAPIMEGNRTALSEIPVGTIVCNVEIEPGRGGKAVRSAGAGAKVLAQEGKYTHLKMPSGESRKFLRDGFATIGQVSHAEHRFEIVGKAGSSRLKGKRPTVRGTAMNPYSHPHGGGEGRAPIGMKHPKTKWGKPAYGVKTRGKKWTDKYILQRRQTKNKSK